MSEISTAQAENLGLVMVWLSRVVATINTANGWRSKPVTKGERIALIHSEASELLEWARKPQKGMVLAVSDHIDDSGEAEELADIVIRVVDYAEFYGIDLGAAIIAKLNFNETRGHRHGGKLI